MPQITMLEDVWDGPTLLAKGASPIVSTELADQLVGVGKAVDSSGYRGARVDATMTDDVQRAEAAAVVEAAGAIVPLRRAISGIPTAMAFGNSICAQNRIGANTVNGSVSFDAHLWWAQAFSGHAFEWLQTGATVQVGASASSLLTQGIYGYSGATSVDIYNTAFAVTLGAYRPNYALIQMIENDVTQIVAGTITRVQAQTAYRNTISGCLAQGTTPIFIGCLPSKSYSTAAHATEYWALTNYVESLQSLYPGMIYVPVSDLYMDSALTTPQPLSSGIYANYTDTSVHPKVAAPLIGARIADILGLHGILGFGLIPGPGDARYIGGNAFTSGTGGTASAPVTGSVANNLTIANNMTSATIAAAVVNRNGRQAQQISVTAGTSTGFQNMFSEFTSAINSGPSSFAVGDIVQLLVEFEIDSATALTGLRDLTLELAHTGGAVTPYQMFKKANADTFDTITIPTGRPMVFATPLSVVTPGTTAVRPFFYAYASQNAAAATGRFFNTKFAVVNWSKSN
ncbi:SGNH/GDSL hydrolase family protein [Methyloversatilis universalis]|nr:SGNH/GDSL hydrolase family protein [Methyloversatilis universalis]